MSVSDFAATSTNASFTGSYLGWTPIVSALTGSTGGRLPRSPARRTIEMNPRMAPDQTAKTSPADPRHPARSAPSATCSRFVAKPGERSGRLALVAARSVAAIASDSDAAGVAEKDFGYGPAS
jgi:hypothetical protein